MTFELWIPGEPVSWKRSGRRKLPDGRVISYDPKEARAWKSTFIELASRKIEQQGGSLPLFGHPTPVFLRLLACFSLPPSLHRKRIPRPAEWLPGGRKDADNLLKLVGDAGNELLWQDDRQLCLVDVMKMRMQQGDPAGIYVLTGPLPKLELHQPATNALACARAAIPGNARSTHQEEA